MNILLYIKYKPLFLLDGYGEIKLFNLIKFLSNRNKNIDFYLSAIGVLKQDTADIILNKILKSFKTKLLNKEGYIDILNNLNRSPYRVRWG